MNNGRFAVPPAIWHGFGERREEKTGEGRRETADRKGGRTHRCYAAFRAWKCSPAPSSGL
nr:hypothetical protein [Bacillaceae bacterium]